MPYNDQQKEYFQQLHSQSGTSDQEHSHMIYDSARARIQEHISTIVNR